MLVLTVNGWFSRECGKVVLIGVRAMHPVSKEVHTDVALVRVSLRIDGGSIVAVVAVVAIVKTVTNTLHARARPVTYGHDRHTPLQGYISRRAVTETCEATCITCKGKR